MATETSQLNDDGTEPINSDGLAYFSNDTGECCCGTSCIHYIGCDNGSPTMKRNCAGAWFLRSTVSGGATVSGTLTGDYSNSVIGGYRVSVTFSVTLSFTRTHLFAPDSGNAYRGGFANFNLAAFRRFGSAGAEQLFWTNGGGDDVGNLGFADVDFDQVGPGVTLTGSSSMTITQTHDTSGPGISVTQVSSFTSASMFLGLAGNNAASGTIALAVGGLVKTSPRISDEDGYYPGVRYSAGVTLEINTTTAGTKIALCPGGSLSLTPTAENAGFGIEGRGAFGDQENTTGSPTFSGSINVATETGEYPDNKIPGFAGPRVLIVTGNCYPDRNFKRNASTGEAEACPYTLRLIQASIYACTTRNDSWSGAGTLRLWNESAGTYYDQAVTATLIPGPEGSVASGDYRFSDVGVLRLGGGSSMTGGSAAIVARWSGESPASSVVDVAQTGNVTIGADELSDPPDRGHYWTTANTINVTAGVLEPGDHDSVGPPSFVNACQCGVCLHGPNSRIMNWHRDGIEAGEPNGGYYEVLRTNTSPCTYLAGADTGIFFEGADAFHPDRFVIPVYDEEQSPAALRHYVKDCNENGNAGKYLPIDGGPGFFIVK